MAPVLFLGHGSPMNAISENSYTKALVELGARLRRPRAILVISAHWMTRGTWVTHMDRPRTIHDFRGFPKELFEIQYPAPGSAEVAELIQGKITEPKILADDKDWGLDHGTWSVLKHIYPKADIPVVQMSLDMTQPPEFHFELGKRLRHLRSEGILIIGSGNIVHNLRLLNWDEGAPPHPWAIEFDDWIMRRLKSREFQSIVSDFLTTEAGRLSVPTPDHYYPLFYVLGAAQPADELTLIAEGIQNASISMRSVQFG